MAAMARMLLLRTVRRKTENGKFPIKSVIGQSREEFKDGTLIFFVILKYIFMNKFLLFSGHIFGISISESKINLSKHIWRWYLSNSESTIFVFFSTYTLRFKVKNEDCIQIFVADKYSESFMHSNRSFLLYLDLSLSFWFNQSLNTPSTAWFGLMLENSMKGDKTNSHRNNPRAFRRWHGRTNLASPAIRPSFCCSPPVVLPAAATCAELSVFPTAEHFVQQPVWRSRSKKQKPTKVERRHTVEIRKS